MKIKKVEIQAFRAYKTKEDGTFDFNLSNNEPSNFVGIYAPNGFGKSSFYDAVEWGITNNVERISGEHNKKIIETAARCTKQEGVGQKILRNKDVNKKLSTFVNISSTNQIFNRSLKIPRSDSKDIPRNKKIENQYFSQVILSQDAIDRFLKETKPEDRYLQFMDYFGKDIEAARKKLTILINDNNSILQKLKADEKNLKDNLSKPVDMSILEQFNSIVKELILRGEEIKYIENNFSLDKEYELNS
ncbi:ATP-binding protein, partial [Acinetobacter baumannii]|nr:ATP-binding protein [Acinetobacter baumannii]